MSIANFYFFDIFSHSHRHYDVKRLNRNLYTNEMLTDGKDIFALTDSKFKITKSCKGMPIDAESPLISVITDNIGELFALLCGEGKIFKSKLDGISVELEIQNNGDCHTVLMPRFFEPREERMAELLNNALFDVSSKVGDATKEFAKEYRQILSNGISQVVSSDVSPLLSKVLSVAKTVRNTSKGNRVVKRNGLAPVIRYSPKDFCRIIITAISVCILVSQRKSVDFKVFTGKKVAALTCDFSCKLPKNIKALMVKGEFDELPYDSEYGSLFLVMGYLQSICRLYGYSVTFTRKTSRSLSFALAFPLVYTPDEKIQLAECVSEEWITETAKKLIIQ